jgi:flagellar biosynthesis GTPase FlhF
MGKIVKGIVLGAAVGAGIRVATDLRNTEDDLGAIAPRVAKTAGEAALAGASVGLLLTVRDKRRAKKIARSLKGAAKVRALAGTGLQVAIPALQHAFEEARPHVVHALEEAKDRADDLRPVLEHASKRARKRANKEWKHAKPKLEKAAKQTRKRAESEWKHAKPQLEKAAKQTREKASNVADLAAERAKRAIADLDLPTAVIAV